MGSLEERMEPDATELFKELRASHERVAGLVAKLAAEELRRPSYDDDWAVSQLLSHLGSGAEITFRRLEAAISGSRQLEQDDFAAIWDRWDSLEPEPVAKAMVEANEACVRRFETLDEATVRDLRLPFFAGGEIDVRGTAAMRLNEHALHAWDAAVTFDPAATIAPGSVEPLLWNLIGQEWIVRRSADAEAVAALAAKLGDRPLLVRTTDPEWWLALDLAGDQPHLRRVEAGGQPHLRIPAEAFLRLVYGRLGPGHTPGGVEVAEPLVIEELRSAFKGY
jgi:Mycothiol maleylpyruvate isomerase N-terminal domain